MSDQSECHAIPPSEDKDNPIYWLKIIAHNLDEIRYQLGELNENIYLPK